MTLQTQDLVMVGLGVKDDVPPNQYQPILRNRIHLRWVFNKSLGFPWYGFTLFRRLHNKGGDICVTGAYKYYESYLRYGVLCCPTLASRLPTSCIYLM